MTENKIHAGKEYAHLSTLDEVIKAKYAAGDFTPVALSMPIDWDECAYLTDPIALYLPDGTRVL